MKREYLLILFWMISISVFAQNKMIVSYFDSLVIVKIAGTAIAPQFTPGNHHSDNYLSFVKKGDNYETILPVLGKGMSSGRIAGTTIIYHNSSGYVPTNLNKKLTVRVNIPKGKKLIWAGRMWNGPYAELTFPDYFVAREFPIIFVKEGSYLKRISRFNAVDSLTIFYVWEDGLQTSLPKAFRAVDTAANIVGSLVPSYLHKFIVNYSGRNYTLVYIINSKLMTGLEHFNSPYVITVPSFISVDGIVHTLFHSMNKGVTPEEYMRKDGKFYPSDALGFYEGLTTFLSNSYIKDNFAAHLSASIYRAKLSPECSDLTQISICGAESEKWYADGYLFWIFMQGQGMNVRLFTQWLYTIELINAPFPVKINWKDVLHWIYVYDERLGKIAEDNYQGEYLQKAFQILKDNGWSPIPVYEIPRWYDLYIGPYSLIPGGVQLPTDNYPATKAYPKFLVNSDSSKLLLESKKDNPALMFIKAHPDSVFQIEFSDGIIRQVENKLKFSDGSQYFMHGTINITEQNKEFWKRLNVYLFL